MKRLLAPAGAVGSRSAVYGVAALLGVSATSLLAAPRLMPPSYSWLSNTTSESAAQGVLHAWVARLGFLALGLAVLWLAAALRTIWARLASWMHVAFGVLMTATAAFSHRPWIAGAPFDPVEDALHSFTATAMGFAFSFGVVARLMQRTRRGEAGRALDATALVAATAIPLLMAALPEWDGLFQRSVFLVVYAWYAREALLIPRLRGGGERAS